MAIFKYRAKKGPQTIVEGRLEAPAEKDAVERINQMGYIPIRVEEEFQSAGAREHARKRRFGRVRPREITIVSRQLASLLKSGVPILTAIDIIAEQSESNALKNILNDIRGAVKDGGTFSSTLAEHPRVFSPLYIAMIRAGEDSASLPEALLRIADYRAKQEEMFARFRMAMAYPILMALVGIATVVFMLTFVMPRLMGIFSSMGQNLPLPTRILIAASERLRTSWFWIVTSLAVVILLLKREAGTKAGRFSLSLLKLHLPILGSFTLKADLARFARTMELLIKSGIPILQTIDISIPVLDNEIIKDHLRNSYKDLEQGGSFGRSLKNARIFPLFLTNLLIVGEESGRLDEALGEVASSYERDTDEAMKVMASLLEPLMILMMGLIVGFIVVAMLLPIFEINVAVR